VTHPTQAKRIMRASGSTARPSSAAAPIKVTNQQASSRKARGIAEQSSSLQDSGWLAFEEHGSFSGPPSRPEAFDIGATSLLLHWEPPSHLGGSGFEVLGYHVRVRYSGDGEFALHVENTGSATCEHAIEQLSADTWHEFTVAAITSAGVGAASIPSRPVLTERAPKLLRDLRTASKQLSALRDRLARKRSQLLELVTSGTMALRPASSDLAERGEEGDGAPLKLPPSFPPGHDEPLDERSAPPAQTGSRQTLSADETRRMVRSRKQLERQVEALSHKVEEQERVLSELTEMQDSTDARRHQELEESAHHLRESHHALGEGSQEGIDAHGGRPRIYGGTPLSHAAVGVSDTPYTTHTNTRRSLYGSHAHGDDSSLPRRGEETPSTAAVGSKSNEQSSREPSMSRHQGRHRQSQTVKEMQALEAYTRLFLEEDVASEESYPPFQREMVRAQLRRALSRNVLTAKNGPTHEKAHYFDLVLNRTRSAVTHNVFPRFSDWELEQLVLLFGRFDADHDGVLEFGDFCRLMLLVADRVQATYHEKDLYVRARSLACTSPHSFRRRPRRTRATSLSPACHLPRSQVADVREGGPQRRHADRPQRILVDADALHGITRKQGCHTHGAKQLDRIASSTPSISLISRASGVQPYTVYRYGILQLYRYESCRPAVTLPRISKEKPINE
jgi:hypothetical protein